MIGNKKMTLATFALALSAMSMAQSRKVINLPSWDFSRDGKLIIFRLCAIVIVERAKAKVANVKFLCPIITIYINNV